jgi:RNA polymerase sigma factor (sigma-70 family)
VEFEEFVAARMPALLRFATVVIGDPEYAAEVVLAAMVKAGRRWRRIRRMPVPEDQLKRLIVAEYLSWRRRKAVRALPVAEPPADEDVDKELWAGLAELAPRQRVVLALRFYERLGPIEIAELLDWSEATVRMHGARGMAALG